MMIEMDELFSNQETNRPFLKANWACYIKKQRSLRYFVIYYVYNCV